MAEPRTERGGTLSPPPPTTPPEEQKEPSSTYQVVEGRTLFSENFGHRYSGELVVCTDKEAKSWGEGYMTRVGDEKELARRQEQKKLELEARLQQGA